MIYLATDTGALSRWNGTTYEDAAGGGGGLTQEQTEDIVAALIQDNSDLDWTYDDGGPSLVALVKNDAITYAKIQNVSATSRVLGRISSGAGDVEELTGANIATIAAQEMLPEDVWVFPYAPSTSSGTWVPAVGTGSTFNIQSFQSSPADAQYWETVVKLRPGTYTFQWVHAKATNAGIGRWTLDGAEISNTDTYNGSTTYVITTTTGYAVTGDRHLLRLTVNGKNASSSNYYLNWAAAHFIRTGS
jgi:hypothetical protein